MIAYSSKSKKLGLGIVGLGLLNVVICTSVMAYYLNSGARLPTILMLLLPIVGSMLLSTMVTLAARKHHRVDLGFFILLSLILVSGKKSIISHIMSVSNIEFGITISSLLLYCYDGFSSEWDHIWSATGQRAGRRAPSRSRVDKHGRSFELYRQFLGYGAIYALVLRL